MRKAILAGLPLAFVAIVQLTGPAAAQDPASQRDPESVAALERMGAALRAMDSFAVHADVTREDVLSTGQKIQYSGTLDIQARSRNAFRIDFLSSRQNRSYYYDGQNLTVVAPRANYYASAPVTGTSGEVIVRAREKFDIDFPLADLFTFGSDPAAISRITSAIPIGLETINGQSCAQHAMRQEGIDWQVWIREGDNPLPCKIVITTTSDASMPQYSAVMNWEPRQTFADGTFTYSPSASSRRIALGTVPASLAPTGN
jgi:hypothetical protein